MKMKQYAKRALAMAAAAMLTVSGVGGFTPAQAEQVGTAPQYPFMDTSLSFEERAADLVSRLTLDEKVNQLGRNGAAVPRLGLAKYDYWNEALHGIQNGSAEGTSYPMPLGLAQTWDEEYIKVIANAIADDARGHSQPTSEGGRGRGLTYWCPTVNMERSPIWGRTNEAYGEDTYVSGMLASAFSEGMMGDLDVKTDANGRQYMKTVPTIKHYALNNHENGRGSTSSNASEADIRDYYTRVYRYIIERTDVPSLMSAYNAVNYTPSSGNTFLLDTLLRKTFGFTGFVTSDCGAIDNLEKTQKWVPTKNVSQKENYTLAAGKTISDYVDANGVVTKPGSVALALMAGCDMDCNGDVYPTNAKKAVQQGILSEDQVDKNVYNNLLSRFKLGEFDPDEMVEYRSAAYSFKNTVETPEHTELAKDAASRSAVLLKNQNNTLPLDVSKVSKIVIVGDNADVCWTGNYSGKPQKQHQISLYEGIKDYLVTHNDKATVEKVTSFGDNGTISAADQKLIKDADVVIAFGSDIHDDSSEGHDRVEMKLTRNQNEIIKKTASLNKNTIVYLQTSNTVEIKEFKDQAKAIIWTTQNGEAQGIGAANQLFGEYNISGKLTFTWYKDESQLPGIRQYGLKEAYTEGEKLYGDAEKAYSNGGFTYQYFTGDVEYPFGYGLSYTTYAYSNMKVDKTTVDANGKLTVSVDVENTGKMDGSEVVQVYVKYPQADGMPAKQIKGYEKVDLKAGEKKTANIELDVSDFYFWNDAAQKEVVPTGEYTIEVGASSADIKDSKKVTVTGALAEQVNVVTADASALAINVGESLTTEVTASLKDDTLLEMGAKDLKVEFSSNKPEVASVDATGKVTGKAAGTATITVKASYKNGEVKETSFPVAVKTTVKATELTVNGSKVADFDADTTTYNVTVKNGSVPTVAAKAASGVTVNVEQAKAVPGTATVTLTKGSEKAVYTVNVVDACDVTAIAFENVKLTKAQAASYTLDAKATTATCDQAAHKNAQATYAYKILKDTTGSAKLNGNVLSATAEGRVTVQVTATFNGATKVASAQIWVTDAPDRTKLEEAVRVKVTGDDYDPASLNAYYAELEKARKVLLNENATQAEIDAAYESLKAVKDKVVDYTYLVANFPGANKTYSYSPSGKNIYIDWQKIKNADNQDTIVDLTTHKAENLELRFTITLSPSDPTKSFKDSLNNGSWFKLRSSDKTDKEDDPDLKVFGGTMDTNGEHNFGWAVGDYIKDWGTTEVVIPLAMTNANTGEMELPEVSKGNGRAESATFKQIYTGSNNTSRGKISWNELDRFFGIINLKDGVTATAKLENVRVVDKSLDEKREELNALLTENVAVEDCKDAAAVKAYKEAVAVAKNVIKGENVVKIIDATNALKAAREALGVSITVDKTALKKVVDNQVTDLTRYTASSVATYKAKIAEAQALLNKADATQLEVNRAVSALGDVSSVLQLQTGPNRVVATLLEGEQSTADQHFLELNFKQDVDLIKEADYTVTVQYQIKLESTHTNPAPTNDEWLKEVRNGRARFWNVSTPNNDNASATWYSMNCEQNSVMTAYNKAGEWMTVTQEIPVDILEDGRLTQFGVFMYNDTARYGNSHADEVINWNNDTGVKMTIKDVQILSNRPENMNVPDPDAKELKDVLATAKAINQNQYTETTAKALQAAITKAEGLVDTAKTQLALNNARKELQAAIDALVQITYGDVTMDGTVDIVDALVTLQNVAGKVTLSDRQLEAANVDGEAGVSAADALLILQHANGARASFPVEE